MKITRKQIRRIIKEYGYGGNLTLAHVQKVFPHKSKGEQIDIHEEFGESTNNAQELTQAYIEKYGSLRENRKRIYEASGNHTLEITQDAYNQFTDMIADGYGWIDPDDVARQWKGVIGTPLSDAALQYLISNLDANGLIADPADKGEW